MKLPDHSTIETKRLLLRPLEKEDLLGLFALNGDEEVMRYSMLREDPRPFRAS